MDVTLPGSQPVNVKHGAMRFRKLICGNTPCVTARAAGSSTSGVHYVPRELTGTVTCNWCGALWRALPNDMTRDARA